MINGKEAKVPLYHISHQLNDHRNEKSHVVLIFKNSKSSDVFYQSYLEELEKR